mmetsp:Transcript_12007/g.33109  ORF Transcript_12007/g.33109 Transcript_12007/m.33109 type:complete len:82 (-) Transcript_12007:14-259(-)
MRQSIEAFGAHFPTSSMCKLRVPARFIPVLLSRAEFLPLWLFSFEMTVPQFLKERVELVPSILKASIWQWLQFEGACRSVS